MNNHGEQTMSLITKIKKVGAAAAGTLMLGATLGAAVSLADYPSPFVQDGEVQNPKQVVVGSQGSNPAGLASDIVGGIDIAASLGNKAVKTETKTKTVSTEGAGAGWSASSGVTLDTRNDDIYFGNDVNKVRQTLTKSDLSLLTGTTFRDNAGNTYDISNYLNIGSESVDFGNNPDGLDDSDPAVHVKVPAESEVSDTNYLFSLQANIGDINFSSSDVKSEDVELFGKTYTVSSGDNSVGDSKLVLFGSSETTAVSSGETATVTVGGEEHDIGVTAVTGSDVTAVTVDGDLEEYNEGEEFVLSGETVRVDNIIQTDSQTSKGVVKFAMGSEELRLENGKAVEDGDGDDIEGTYVKINGANSYSVGDGVSSIEIFVGSEDSDSDYLKAGEKFTHSLFDGYTFQFGGLSPDASETGENVGQVEVSASSDVANVDFKTGEGNDASIGFGYAASTGSSASVLSLQADENDDIHVVENAEVSEDQFFLADAGDFAHMWEVTSVDTDEDNNEATVDIKDVVTGSSKEVTLDRDSDSNPFTKEEIIDGQTYHFNIDDGATKVEVTWGSGSDFDDAGKQTSLFPALDQESGAAVSFSEPVTLTANQQTGLGTYADGDALTLPSGTGFSTIDVTVTVTNDASGTGANTAKLVHDGNDIATGITEDGNSYDFDFRGRTYTVGTSDDSSSDDSTMNLDTVDVTYNAGLPSTESTNAEPSVTVDSNSGTAQVDSTQTGTTSAAGVTYEIDNNGGNSDVVFAVSHVDSPSADDSADNDGATVAVIEPEHNDGNEYAYLVTPKHDGTDNDDEVEVYGDNSAGTISYPSTAGNNGVQLDSDDKIYQDYDSYGTFSEDDQDGQGSFTLNIPNGQAVAGAAVTSSEGELSATGGSGSATVEYTETTASGVPDMGMLDSEVTSSAKTNKNLILVGGPAVNALTEELASQDNSPVWSLEDWRDGEHGDMSQVVLVEDAFTEGKVAMVVAGHEAEDTRAAAKVLANHDKDAYSDLFAEGSTEITLSKSEYQTAWSN